MDATKGLGVLMGGLVLAASAWSDVQIYHWIGPDGQMHYADILPAGQNAQLLEIGTREVTSEAAVATAEALEAELAASRAERQQARAEARELASGRAALQRECEQARAYLQRLQSARRLAYLDADDNPTFYSGDERVALIEDALDRVRLACE